MNCLATLDPSLMFLERLLMLENGHLAVFRKSMQIRAYPCSPEQNPVNTAATVRPPHNLRSDSFAFHAARIACLASPPTPPSRKSSTTSGLLKNTEIEKIARTTRSGTFLGQYGSVRDETGASRKLLTCLTELPPGMLRPLYRYC